MRTLLLVVVAVAAAAAAPTIVDAPAQVTLTVDGTTVTIGVPQALPTQSGGTGDPIYGDLSGVYPTCCQEPAPPSGVDAGGPLSSCALPVLRVGADGRITDVECQEWAEQPHYVSPVFDDPPAPPVSPPPPPRMDIVTLMGTLAVVLWTLVPLGLVVAALVGAVNLTTGKRKRYLIRLDPLLGLLGDLDAEHQANEERRRALVEERTPVAAELLSQPKYTAPDYWTRPVPLDILGLNAWTMLNVVLPAIEAHSPQFEFRIMTPWWQRALGWTAVEVVHRRDCPEARPVKTMRPLAVHWTALEVTHAAGCASFFVAPAAAAVATAATPAVSVLP